MSRPLPQDQQAQRGIDRREFLGVLGLATGGAALAFVLPARAMAEQLQLPIAGAAPPLEGDGHVDDAWGHWPPYAHPIPYGQAQFAPAAFLHVNPVDQPFVT